MSSFVINSERVRTNCINCIVVDHDSPLEVVIRPHKQDRSAAQRRLQNKWIDEVAAQLGEQRIVFRNRFLRWFGKNIFWVGGIVLAGPNDPLATGCPQRLPTGCLIAGADMVLAVNKGFHQDRSVTPLRLPVLGNTSSELT